MTFFIEDTARLATPSEEELRRFYQANLERFQPSTRITFSHVFFHRDRQGGTPELIAVWKDPDFDAEQRAFYYARVLEIPTPRWTAYDAKRFGVKPLPDTAMSLQERTYTSPIWYTPAK
jgi:hypothetical protein